jgi:hypothetical protein
MQSFLSASVLMAALVSVAHAQVTAEIVFDQEQFLRSESLPIRLRINNLSGQTLRLGNEPDWLSFTVESREGRPLKRTGEVPLPKPFSLESSKTISLRTDLMPHFNLSEPGHYSVKAKIKIAQLEKELTTTPKTFDIITGTKVWEREVGVPGTTPPEVRRFALQQATFLKQLRLYVRVTDAKESIVFRVLPLGTLTSFSQPEPIVDSSSQLHVLFQNGPRSFLYSVISPDGEQLIRQTWDYAGDSRPRLRAEDDGRVIVNGGVRRILLSDLPPPRVANSDDKSQSK